MTTTAPKTVSTIDLVRQAQAGEAGAREELFARYSDRVLEIVRVRLGPSLRSACQSTDILQDAMASALQGFERFEMREPSSLIRWFSRIVENRIRARVERAGAVKRSAAKEVALAQESATGSVVELALPSSQPTPSAAVQTIEEQALVRDTLAELPEREREIILLRNYAGEDWARIAEECGVSSADAARMIYTRALVRLGGLLRRAGLR